MDLSKPEIVVLERVRGRGFSDKDEKAAWGASNNFNMGRYFGQIELALCSYCELMNVKMLYVDPKQWQSLIHDEISKKIPAKQRSLAAYKRFHPNSPIKTGTRGTDKNMIDAILIATYGIMKFTKDGFNEQKWEFINDKGDY